MPDSPYDQFHHAGGVIPFLSDHTPVSYRVRYRTKAGEGVLSLKLATWNILDIAHDLAHCPSTRAYEEGRAYSNNPFNADEDVDAYRARKRAQILFINQIIGEAWGCDLVMLQEADFAFMQEVYHCKKRVFAEGKTCHEPEGTEPKPDKKCRRAFADKEGKEGLAFREELFAKLDNAGWGIMQAPDRAVDKVRIRKLMILYRKERFRVIPSPLLFREAGFPMEDVLKKANNLHQQASQLLDKGKKGQTLGVMGIFPKLNQKAGGVVSSIDCRGMEVLLEEKCTGERIAVASLHLDYNERDYNAHLSTYIGHSRELVRMVMAGDCNHVPAGRGTAEGLVGMYAPKMATNVEGDGTVFSLTHEETGLPKAYDGMFASPLKEEKVEVELAEYLYFKEGEGRGVAVGLSEGGV
jgi:hypothetical protein